MRWPSASPARASCWSGPSLRIFWSRLPSGAAGGCFCHQTLRSNSAMQPPSVAVRRRSPLPYPRAGISPWLSMHLMRKWPPSTSCLQARAEQSFRRHDRCCESNANLRWEQVAFRIMCALILITNLWQLTQNAPQPEARTERFDAIHE